MSQVYDTQGLKKAAGAGGNTGSISAGGASASLGQVVFSNSNGVSFGLNGQTVTATVQTNYLTTAMLSNAVTLSNIRVSAGTTSNLLSALTFADGGGVSFGIDASTITATVQTNYLTTAALSNHSHGNPQLNLTNLAGTTNSNSAGFTLSLSANATVPETPFGVSAGTQSVSTGTLVFSNSNGITFGMSGSSRITASHDGITTGMASNRGSDFVQATAAFFGTNASGTIASGAISVSVAAPGGGGGNITVSDTATSLSVSRLAFTNSNGVTMTLSTAAGAATVIASHNGLTSQSNQAFSAAGGSSAFQTLSFGDTNSVSWTNTNGSVGIASIKLQMFAVSNTTQSSSGTANHTAFSFAGAGVASVGVTGGTVVVSVPAAGGAVTYSSHEPYPLAGASTASASFPNATSGHISVFPFSLFHNLSAGIVDFLMSASTTSNGTSSGRRTITQAMGLYTRNGVSLNTIASASFSWAFSASSSSLSVSQPMTTNYTGYVTGSTSSNGAGLQPVYNGLKLVGFPLNTLLTPGEYWVGLLGLRGTSGAPIVIGSIGIAGEVVTSGPMGLAPMGSDSTAFSTGTDLRGGRWYMGMGSFGSVSAMPASIHLSAVSGGGSGPMPHMRFWST